MCAGPRKRPYGPCHSVGPGTCTGYAQCGTPVDEHDSCVPCGGGASGAMGRGVSAQSLQSTPGGEARLGPFQSGPTPLVINVTNRSTSPHSPATARPAQPRSPPHPSPRRPGDTPHRHPPPWVVRLAPRARASFPVTAYTPTAVRVSRFNGNRRAVRLRYKNKFTFFYRSPITPTPLTRFRF